MTLPGSLISRGGRPLVRGCPVRAFQTRAPSSAARELSGTARIGGNLAALQPLQGFVGRQLAALQGFDDIVFVVARVGFVTKLAQ